MERRTYGGLLKEAETFLSGHQVEEWSLDAWYLFSSCFSMDRAGYYLKRDCTAEEEETDTVARFRSMVERRGARIPLQYILGEQEFMGLSFRVNEHVLIPRQDTETLVERVLEDVRRTRAGAEGLHILDLCTGSGCIGISLAHYLRGYPELQVTLSDISADALRVARENICRLGCKDCCRVLQSDLFGAFKEKPGERFQVIVSNPPYIPSRDIEGLEPEVREHEPLLALDGEKDGLAFYRRIASEAAGYLTSDGEIYLEIGWNQGTGVESALMEAGFRDIEIIKDLTGRDRVVKAAVRRLD
ncbi:peptide chain release factor N(5)-glutamine methyltransferase [Lacrimispora sp. NSJ-141]|uniref:Release factor glutamine methyltransferase n=1 Tax=Lientehia hominis TaxID=2897778 RepID=A0AAP2W843_9FIRM|nr:peptide chain release factor N(5)-glutamine methyltransferase [Lientehia hominis]MCD2493078.1 peptide chain release factor N(5)-glutamine methyltransferase [Lientehia hominis]